MTATANAEKVFATEQAALKLVCNPLDWKDEIHAVLHVDLACRRLSDEIEGFELKTADQLKELLIDAISNATATIPHFEPLQLGHEQYLIVTAAGYRMGPCGTC